MDPANGPALVSAAAALRQSPHLNASSVSDWYGTFRAWCHKSYGGVHLCRDTMSKDMDAKGVGYLSKQSFDDFLSLFIAGNQALAGDMKMSGPILGLKLQSAKFSASTPKGAVQSYAVQRDLPGEMHRLAQKAFPVVAAASRGAGYSQGLSSTGSSGQPAVSDGVAGDLSSAGSSGQQAIAAISYSPAFPFFELWEPAHSDLVTVALVQSVGACLTCFLVLGLSPALMVVLCVLASACSMLLALDRIFAQDLNMITAVNWMIFVPVGTDLFFHLGFRATALSCLRCRPSSDDGSQVDGCGVTSSGGKDEQHAVHSAQLVAIVVLPGTIGFAATVGFVSVRLRTSHVYGGVPTDGLCFAAALAAAAVQLSAERAVW